MTLLCIMGICWFEPEPLATVIQVKTVTIPAPCPQEVLVPCEPMEE